VNYFNIYISQCRTTTRLRCCDI